MNIALWVTASILAAAFLASGAAKILQPREKLIAGGNRWAEDYSSAQVKLLGGAEIAGALGITLPAALGILVILVPIAATGLALIMFGASVVHVRRDEAKLVGAPLALGVITLIVALLRFGQFV